MSSKSLILMLVLLPCAAWAQTATPGTEFTPPPMVPASPPPMPPAEPLAQPTTVRPPGTPLPPGAQQPSGYQYSPYGQPRTQEKPKPEIGLMVSESLFGMLSAAGITVLPYFLLGTSLQGTGDLMGILIVAIFGLTPVAVSQTQTGIANGSAYYQIDSWVPLLAGLAGEALVLTTYYLANNNSFIPPPSSASTGGVPAGQGAVIWLFIGTIGVVPLLQMAAINLFKQSKVSVFGSLGKPDKNGFALGVPLPAPVVAQTSAGLSVGAQLQFFRGTW